jgi:hypothetical protein
LGIKSALQCKVIGVLGFRSHAHSAQADWVGWIEYAQGGSPKGMPFAQDDFEKIGDFDSLEKGDGKDWLPCVTPAQITGSQVFVTPYAPATGVAGDGAAAEGRSPTSAGQER